MRNVGDTVGIPKSYKAKSHMQVFFLQTALPVICVWLSNHITHSDRMFVRLIFGQ